MLIAILLAVALPAALAAPEPIRVSCLPQGSVSSGCEVKFGCQSGASGSCSLVAGEGLVSTLPARSLPNEVTPPRLRLVAALDSSLRAVVHSEGVTFSVSKGIVSAQVSQPRDDVVLDRVRIFGFPSDASPPRVLRLNGKLLRRGDLHFHRDSQSVELYDLALPLTENWQLELLSTDVEADQVECAVSYSKRNQDFSIPPSSCSSPCVWDGSDCWMPSPLTYGYLVDGPAETTQFGSRIPLAKFGSDIHGAAIQRLTFEVFIYSDTLVRFKIYDSENARYEVPVALNLPSTPFTGQTNYDVIFPTIQGSPFFVQVVRRDTGTIIFDTSMVGITFEDQLLSVALRVPSRNLFGLGESSHGTFRREFDDSTWPIWARDEPPSTTRQANLYGTHPFYEVIENDDNAHGVLLYNSNAMEYQLQSAAPAVVWRTLGGVLDFFVVTGPTPEDVIKQYTQIIGRSFLPPYWSLGFQQSRYGYNSLENMRASIERTKSCEIPLDVFYGDIDIMDNQGDFTIGASYAGLPEFVNEQRAEGLRFVPILDPAIAYGRPGYATYDRGLASDAYIRMENGDVLLGNVWPPEPVSFPDFFRSNTSRWWTDEIKRYYQTLAFDGLWIDMNEPANFDTNVPGEDYTLLCPPNSLDDPPYVPKAGAMGPTNRLSDKTICLNTRQGDNNIYSHYDVHNLYGYSETIPTSASLQEVTGKRGLVFTRSSFVGSGILGGHWTGDNTAAWDHMRFSVIGLLDFNLFGLPYVGADICGYFDNTTERLCERWQQLGAFYPFARNHNTIGTMEQDPCLWPNTVGASTRKAVTIRYRLLPYFYTTFYRANQGIEGTVIRSLVHQFTEDRETLTADRQFLWGDALLVSPALDEGATTTAAYLPAGRWYDYYTGQPLNSIGQYVILDAPTDFIPIHVRGGRILPVQRPDLTTTASRKNAFGLIIALDESGAANGDLFWDDGESIDTVKAGTYHTSKFTFADSSISQIITHPDPQALLAGKFIEDVEVFGVEQMPTGVTGDVGTDAFLAFDTLNKKVSILNAHIPIDIPFSVTFTY